MPQKQPPASTARSVVPLILILLDHAAAMSGKECSLDPVQGYTMPPLDGRGRALRQETRGVSGRRPGSGVTPSSFVVPAKVENPEPHAPDQRQDAKHAKEIRFQCYLASSLATLRLGG